MQSITNKYYRRKGERASVLFVESVRINGNPHHRYVKYIGSRDKLIKPVKG